MSFGALKDLTILFGGVNEIRLNNNEFFNKIIKLNNFSLLELKDEITV
jgi:hypothetical protein